MGSTKTSDHGAVPTTDSSSGPGAQPVQAVISPRVTQLAPTTTLRRAAAALRRDDVSVATVGDGKAIDGVISERDLVASIDAGLDPDASTVEQLASHSLKWAAAGSSVGEVAREMLETHVRHVLVCDHAGDLVGIVSMRDLLAAYVE